MVINFISSKYSDEIHTIHTKNNNTEIIMGNETDQIIEELHKISLNRGGSYIDSPEQLKKKKKTINSKNNDDKRFQYAITAALNYGQIKSHSERI